jgi:hypothetical protein
LNTGPVVAVIGKKIHLRPVGRHRQCSQHGPGFAGAIQVTEAVYQRLSGDFEFQERRVIGD